MSILLKAKKNLGVLPRQEVHPGHKGKTCCNGAIDRSKPAKSAAGSSAESGPMQHRNFAGMQGASEEDLACSQSRPSWR